LMPMRNSIRPSDGTSALRAAIIRCTSTAQRTASTTLENSAQHAVAGVLHYSAVVLSDFWTDQLAEMRPETLVRPLFVRPHQPRIARHIGGEDRGKSAFYGLLHGFPQERGS